MTDLRLRISTYLLETSPQDTAWSLMRAPTERLLWMAEKGDADAFQQLLERHRDRLVRLVSLRLDLRLRARFVPDDVAQGVMAEGLHRRSDYFTADALPIYVWLREIAVQRLSDLHRVHLPFAPRVPEELLAKSVDWHYIFAMHTPEVDAGSISQLNHRQRQRGVRSAIAELCTADREMLVLRHLEKLSTVELSAMLKITSSAAIARYRRALDRLCINASRILFDVHASEAAS